MINAKRTSFVLTVLLFAAQITAAEPDHVFDDGVEVFFLSGDAARRAIVDDQLDPFFDRLSAFEISIRLGRELETDDLARERSAFREHAQNCVVDWTDDEKKAITEVLESAHKKCAAVAPRLLPRHWRFIKTNGKESGAPYTRGDSIVLPQAFVRSGVREHLILHETFHVYSRTHPRKRRALYETIGFRPLKKVMLPESLERIRITNPDGPEYAYGIEVRDETDRKITVVPIVHSRYDALQAGVPGLFGYVTFGLYKVTRSNDGWSVVTGEDGKAKLLTPPSVSGFYEQIGRNTHYVLHPDEILADNVTLLVMKRAEGDIESVPTPLILQKIEAILKAQ